MELPKTFAQDHVARDRNGMPLGRVILYSDESYHEGHPFRVALLTVSVARAKKVQALTFYIDGIPYRIPPSVPDLRVRQDQAVHRVNNFTLEPVQS